MATSAYKSRLQRVEEQRSIRRSVLLIVLTFVILGVLIGVGIPVITRLTGLFVNTDTISSDNIPPAPPILLLPYQATNSATLVVRGRAEADAQIYLTRNSTAIDNKKASGTGEFSFEDIGLVDGANQFVAIAMDAAGNKSQSSTMATVMFSTTLPKLEIAQPQDGQVVMGTNKNLEIKGQTDVGNRVTVNDRFLILSNTGNFSTSIQLTEGDNAIKITSSNLVGNITTKELKIAYRP